MGNSREEGEAEESLRGFFHCVSVRIPLPISLDQTRGCVLDAYPAMKLTTSETAAAIQVTEEKLVKFAGHSVTFRLLPFSHFPAAMLVTRTVGLKIH